MALMKKLSSWCRDNKWPLLVFLVLSLFVVSKSLYINGCGSFNEGDDRVHTFPYLFESRAILASGEVPQMNFFDNFGTPLFGDGFTYPFALQSLTYWFFDTASTAMAINIFLISYLTMLALYIFLRGYFTKSIAILVTIFIFWVPGFFEFFKFHQHQMALLPFVVSLILLRLFGSNAVGRIWLSASLFIVLVIFILSTSVDSVVVGILALMLASLFLGDAKRREAFIIFLGSFLAAFIATLPQSAAFIVNILSSVRILTTGNSVLSQSHNFLQTLLSFLLPASLVGSNAINPHLYLTFIVPVGAAVGIYYLLKHPMENKQDGIMTLLLGLLPIVFVLLLLSFNTIRANLPLIKSVDLQRSIWYATPFLGMAFGYFLNQLLHFRVSRGVALTLSSVSIYIFTWYFFICRSGIPGLEICSVNSSTPTLFYGLGVLFFAALLAFYTILFELKHRNSEEVLDTSDWKKILIYAVASFGVLISLVPTPIIVLGMDKPMTCSGYNFTESERLKFYPPSLLSAMEPMSRLASNVPSWWGYDETAIYNSVLGSNIRNLVANASLASYLIKAGAVEMDDGRGDFHFAPPWNTKLLEGLGIRYIIETHKSSELEALGYGLVTTAEDKRHNVILHLYENPKQPTPFYFIDDNKNASFIHSFEFKGNSAFITLPEIQKKHIFVATFAYRPGWYVEIDGKLIPPTVFEDQLIRFNIKPGDKVVRIFFDLYSWKSLLFALLTGIIFLLLTMRINILINRFMARY